MSWFDYLKLIHIALAVLSGTGFLVRGVWMLANSPLLKLRAVRIAPHLVDTLLLAIGVGLAVVSRQYPGTHDWLTVKLTALLVYIGFGLVALRFGRSMRVRAGAFVLALLSFAYMLAVAFTRTVVPWA